MNKKFTQRYQDVESPLISPLTRGHGLPLNEKQKHEIHFALNHKETN